MMERVFLGWDRPFLTRATDWLLEQRDSLPGMLVMVPTTQSGRRLLESLTEQAGALLTPTIMTPGALLKNTDPAVAADWIEHVAWVQTLAEVADWRDYEALFPAAPDDNEDWLGSFAMEMRQVRRSLQENGLSMAAAAGLLSNTVEADRWSALSHLENLMEHKLKSWGLKSRSRALAARVIIPEGISHIVLAGITEMPPLIERACMAWQGPVSILIGAPENEALAFSASGRPMSCWNEKILPWPDGDQGSVHLVADSRQQAVEAWHVICTHQSASNDVALGSADPETGEELTRTFTRAGWPAFHPAASPVCTGLARWFKVWSKWLENPKLATLADLLALPETAMLIDGQRAEHAERLSRLRNEWMVMRTDDLRHRINTTTFRSDTHRTSAEQVLTLAESLEAWRTDCLHGDLIPPMERLLNTLGHASPDAANESAIMMDWLADASFLMHHKHHDAEFWIELMLADIPAPTPPPPLGRVIDVQGWLEMFFEPGRHLVLCGMNEGMVPACKVGDAWLGEAACKHLGLTTNTDRAARDAFLYQAMIEARRQNGRVDVICAKSNSRGESLLPSRLLLTAQEADLPARVLSLFRGIEPPEAGMRWHADWQWQPRTVDIPKRLGVTTLTTYLACPLRYYLKHAVGMQEAEPDRMEWNARDFGTVAHTIMERWGRDPDARKLTQANAILNCLGAELARIVTAAFGTRVPLAVRIQSEALHQRLVWLAQVQATSRAEGWEIIEVERKIEIPVGKATLVAKIDRIDRHCDNGALRIIDYKTGKVKGVDSEHRRKITNKTVIAAHLGNNSPAVYQGIHHDKPVDFLWHNLQLPLYASAVKDQFGTIPVPCYFTLGASEADVAIHAWDDFSNTDLDAARACAEFIVGKISSGVFWPPAAKAPYDDFAVLAAGKTLSEMFLPENPMQRKALND